jgi:hypothetical protein
MPSKINISELVQLVAKSYNRSELEVFLAQYFDVRLDYIIEPSGLSMIKIAQEVVAYFDRRDNLAEFVREFRRDRPTVDILPLFVPLSATSSSSSPHTISATEVDIDHSELDFYFVIEPDRRIVPSSTKHLSANQAIYVRIPVVSGLVPAASTSPQALALALDRSGSMQGYKTDVARGAADYLLFKG